MNPERTGQTRLTNNSAADMYPVWSPNGTKIAFMSTREGNEKIFLMNSDGTGQTASPTTPQIPRLPIGHRTARRLPFVQIVTATMKSMS